jgi:alanine transaminase
MECYGLDEDVLGEVYKLASVGLCPNVDGQLMMSLMVAPPRLGDASYQSYTEEVACIYGTTPLCMTHFKTHLRIHEVA